MVFVSLVSLFALSVFQIFALLSRCTRSFLLDGMRIVRRAIIVSSRGSTMSIASFGVPLHLNWIVTKLVFIVCYLDWF